MSKISGHGSGLLVSEGFPVDPRELLEAPDEIIERFICHGKYGKFKFKVIGFTITREHSLLKCKFPTPQDIQEFSRLYLQDGITKDTLSLNGEEGVLAFVSSINVKNIEKAKCEIDFVKIITQKVNGT